jgi:hypothetical protein
MRRTIPLLALLVAVGALASGCANTQKKLALGITNVGEVIRWGDMRRSMEQNAVFSTSPSSGAYALGRTQGFSKSLARIGIGAFQVVTCPIDWEPGCTTYVAKYPVYPDSYTPGLVEDALYGTDTNLGFSGGDVMPAMPGSRFRIFDTH